MDAGDRQKVIRRIFAEYVDDDGRKEIMRRLVSKVLDDCDVSEEDRREIVADLETGLMLTMSPVAASMFEDAIEALDRPVRHPTFQPLKALPHRS